MLKNCDSNDFKIEIKGNVFSIKLKIDLSVDNIIFKDNKIILQKPSYEEDLDKALVRGTFLGGGYISNPENKYHLEINFSEKENQEIIFNLLNEYDIYTKKMDKENGFSLYIKDGEEISKFLAFIGANKSVLEFEESRVVRDTKNKVNRLINCETANLSKTIKASEKQIEDIKYIKKKKKFNQLPQNLQEMANIRLAYPEASLTELVSILKNDISKSGISHRLAAISKIADELRNE